MQQIILSGLTVEQLGQIIEDRIKHAFEQKEVAKKHMPIHGKEGKYISRKETAKLLHISLPTLHEWTKEGKLESYRIGTRILYKPEEITEAVKRRNYTNCERKP